MAVTVIDICNSALARLGVEPIVALADQTKGAEACNLRYDYCRRLTLRQHPWNFAIKRAALVTPNVTAPLFGFANAFDMPADVLRVFTVNEDFAVEDWKVEGRQILSDDSTLDIKYVWDLADPTVFDPLYIEYLVCYLAWDICYKLTQSASLKRLLYEEMIAAKRSAKTPDAQESSAESIDSDYFLRARLSGGDPQEPKRNWPPGGV